MKALRFARSSVFALSLATGVIAGPAVDAAAPEDADANYDIDESYFYVSLSSSGNWVQSGQFGWVWYPAHTYAGWRPYTVGRWVWTDYGEWLWVSDEPWGWATYHYGRWYLDPYYGWAWIPGRVWAPAWVSWRDCDDYIGWAPLGPWGYWDVSYHRYRDWDRWDHDHDHGGWDHDHGDGDHDNDHGDWGHDGNHGDGDHAGDHGDRDHARAHGGQDRQGDDENHWNFTRKRDFASTRVDKVVLDKKHVPDVYRRSIELPPPSETEEHQGRGVSRGVDRSVIERAAGRSIKAVKVEDESRPPTAGHHEIKGDRVAVFRPKVGEKPGAPTPDKLGVAKAGKYPGRDPDVHAVDRGRGGEARGEPGTIDRGRGNETPTANHGREPSIVDEHGRRSGGEARGGTHGRGDEPQYHKLTGEQPHARREQPQTREQPQARDAQRYWPPGEEEHGGAQQRTPGRVQEPSAPAREPAYRSSSHTTRQEKPDPRYQQQREAVEPRGSYAPQLEQPARDVQPRHAPSYYGQPSHQQPQRDAPLYHSQRGASPYHSQPAQNPTPPSQGPGSSPQHGGGAVMQEQGSPSGRGAGGGHSSGNSTGGSSGAPGGSYGAPGGATPGGGGYGRGR